MTGQGRDDFESPQWIPSIRQRKYRMSPSKANSTRLSEYTYVFASMYVYPRVGVSHLQMVRLSRRRTPNRFVLFADVRSSIRRFVAVSTEVPISDNQSIGWFCWSGGMIWYQQHQSNTRQSRRKVLSFLIGYQGEIPEKKQRGGKIYHVIWFSRNFFFTHTI